MMSDKITCFGYNMKEAKKTASCAAELVSGLSGAVDAVTEILKSLLLTIQKDREHSS